MSKKEKYDAFAIYSELCQHRVTHSTKNYELIEDIIQRNATNAELVQSDDAGLLFRIGDSPDTMFISHMDMVESNYSYVSTYTPPKSWGQPDDTVITEITIEEKPVLTLSVNDLNIVSYDGKQNMGADDKAGITVLLGMIYYKVNGYYLFTKGEESGGIGAKYFVADTGNAELIDSLHKVVSFDRRGTHSIITEQGGKRCCSDDFAIHVAKLFREEGMFHIPDPTGSYTCSKEFIYNVPECTNISVGYLHEHNKSETLDMDYLCKLIKVVTKIDWASIPVYKDKEVKPVYHYPAATTVPGYSHISSYGSAKADTTKMDTLPLFPQYAGKYNRADYTDDEEYTYNDSIYGNYGDYNKKRKKKGMFLDCSFSISQNTLLIEVASGTIDQIAEIICSAQDIDYEGLEGDVQFIVMRKDYFNQLLIVMPAMRKEYAIKIAETNRLYEYESNVPATAHSLPDPTHIVIYSENINDKIYGDLETLDVKNLGISEEEYALTDESPVSIMTLVLEEMLY